MPVIQESRGVYMPIGKTILQRDQPLEQAGLASVDLLPAPNEANDRAPIGVAIHDAY
jgi:hypothetical protein